MPPSTIIHLMRHAQHDSLTGRLSDDGTKQALTFANLFKDAHHITHIFCSPEIRCKQSAEIALREVSLLFGDTFLDPRERNEVVMISHGSVLPTLFQQHHADYREQDFPNVEGRSYILIHHLEYVIPERLPRKRGEPYPPPSSWTVFKRKSVAISRALVKCVSIC